MRFDPKVVCLGGGTGLSTTLRGLKAMGCRPTAIVTLSDDGGSSGRLRRDLGVPPPGDVRACITALAEDEDVMTRLMAHRFQRGELAGHAVGNLLLAGMTELVGSFDAAVELASRTLAIRGRVLPATGVGVALVAEMMDGRVVAGEAALAHDRSSVRRLALEPWNPPASEAAIEAIDEADLIVLGPGSLFTSTIPPLLVPGIHEAVLASSARRLYVANLLQQPGETLGYDAATHVRRLHQHLGAGIVHTVLVPTVRRVPTIDHQTAVLFVKKELRATGVEVVVARITDGFRHDPLALGRAVLRQARRRKPGAVAREAAARAG